MYLNENEHTIDTFLCMIFGQGQSVDDFLLLTAIDNYHIVYLSSIEGDKDLSFHSPNQEVLLFTG